MSRFIDIKTLVVALVTAALVAGLFIVSRNLTSPLKTTINTDRASIVEQVQSLERLETTSFTIEKVIEAGSEEGEVWKKLLFGDRLLLIAHGKAIAGFDLKSVTEKDVKVSGKILTITLPAPIILSTTLNNADTKVFDRQTGILNRGDKDLEAEARQAAEKSIQEAACEGGILREARDQGKVFVTRMFRLAGFEKVEVSIPEGNC